MAAPSIFGGAPPRLRRRELAEMSMAQRRSVGTNVMGAIAFGDAEALREYRTLCYEVLDTEFALHPSQAYDATGINRVAGSFSAEQTVCLLESSSPRTATFARGVMAEAARLPDKKPIIDAGTGGTAILAMAAATVAHPLTPIHAYEVNSLSAAMARRMTCLMGFDNVEVIEGDVLTADVSPATGLAITETFDAGLRREQGPAILHHLSAMGAERIFPGRVRLWGAVASEETGLTLGSWQHAVDLDLARQNERIKGVIYDDLKGAPGKRHAFVRANYFTQEGNLILAGPDGDSIVDKYRLGTVFATEPGSAIGFDYSPGSVTRDDIHLQIIGS